MRPLWASTTWNSWMRSRFSVSLTSMRSASPRVPTSENDRSRWSAAKSSQAARNSRLSWARRLGIPPAPPRNVELEEGVPDEVAVDMAFSFDQDSGRCAVRRSSAPALLLALCPSTASADGRAVLAFWPQPEEEACAEAADADGRPPSSTRSPSAHGSRSASPALRRAPTAPSRRCWTSPPGRGRRSPPTAGRAAEAHVLPHGAWRALHGLARDARRPRRDRARGRRTRPARRVRPRRRGLCRGLRAQPARGRGRRRSCRPGARGVPGTAATVASADAGAALRAPPRGSPACPPGAPAARRWTSFTPRGGRTSRSSSCSRRRGCAPRRCSLPACFPGCPGARSPDLRHDPPARRDRRDRSRPDDPAPPGRRGPQRGQGAADPRRGRARRGRARPPRGPLRVVGPRRFPALETVLAAWLALVLALGVLADRRGVRAALRIGALTMLRCRRCCC